MYTTTDPQNIAAEMQTAIRTLARYEGSVHLCMAHADAVSAALRTLEAYGDCCPRCGRKITDVGDGESSHILPDSDYEGEWCGVELCVECAEYLDPSPRF